jgi:hypothetical protein
MSQLRFIERPGKGLIVSSDPVGMGAAIWDELLAWMNLAAADIGRKDMIDALDTNKSTLSEALTGQVKDRRIPLEWLGTVMSMTNSTIREQLLRILCRPFGYEPERIVPPDPVEENARMREYFALQSPAALAAYDKEHGR